MKDKDPSLKTRSVSGWSEQVDWIASDGVHVLALLAGGEFVQKRELVDDCAIVSWTRRVPRVWGCAKPETPVLAVDWGRGLWFSTWAPNELPCASICVRSFSLLDGMPISSSAATTRMESLTVLRLTARIVVDADRSLLFALAGTPTRNSWSLWVWRYDARGRLSRPRSRLDVVRAGDRGSWICGLAYDAAYKTLVVISNEADVDRYWVHTIGTCTWRHKAFRFLAHTPVKHVVAEAGRVFIHMGSARAGFYIMQLTPFGELANMLRKSATLGRVDDGRFLVPTAPTRTISSRALEDAGVSPGENAETGRAGLARICVGLVGCPLDIARLIAGFHGWFSDDGVLGLPFSPPSFGAPCCSARGSWDDERGRLVVLVEDRRRLIYIGVRVISVTLGEASCRQVAAKYAARPDLRLFSVDDAPVNAEQPIWTSGSMVFGPTGPLFRVHWPVGRDDGLLIDARRARLCGDCSPAHRACSAKALRGHAFARAAGLLWLLVGDLVVLIELSAALVIVQAHAAHMDDIALIAGLGFPWLPDAIVLTDAVSGHVMLVGVHAACAVSPSWFRVVATRQGFLVPAAKDTTHAQTT